MRQAPMTAWKAKATALANKLESQGHLTDPRWRAALEAVPRHVFVPEFYDDDHKLVDGATTDVDPELVDNRDFRFVLQRYVPGLQSITWTRHDDGAVGGASADDASWAEVVVAEAQPGR